MIETARLTLRPPVIDDLDAIHRMRSDPQVVRFLGGRTMTREEAWQRLLRSAGQWALFGYGFFAVIERASGTLVGEAGFMQAERGLGPPFDPFPEAGWIFAREAQGKGYASEAAESMHASFMRAHGPVRTVCIIDPDNAGSLHVAAKLGYRSFDSARYQDTTVTMLERAAG